MEQKALSDLVVGDEVCVPITAGWGREVTGLHVGPVEKVTATQITALGERWIRSSGRRVGFINRISWPYTLGRVVAEWAFDMEKKGETE